MSEGKRGKRGDPLREMLASHPNLGYTDDIRSGVPMGMEKKRQSAFWSGFAIVTLSLASLAFALSAGAFLEMWERATDDLRLQWRLRLGRHQVRRTSPDITLVAIDNRTQQRLGKFGSGQWLARKPYFDQMLFFEQYFRPSVLAYDIVFQDILGEYAGEKQRVSESPARIEGIRAELNKVALDGREFVSESTLFDITRLSLEQGNDLLSHRFAAIMEDGLFPTIAGCYFRGGWVDPKSASVPSWTREDIVGSDPTGSENSGNRIPYLLDIRIPASDVRFPDARAERAYQYCPNAVFPPQGLLDYTRLGFLNARPDPDGIVRKMPLVAGFSYVNPVTKEEKKVFVPSFALLACLHHLGVKFPLRPSQVEARMGERIVIRCGDGREIRVPVDAQGQMHLNFYAKIDDFNAVSFVDVAPSYMDTAGGKRASMASAIGKAVNGRLVVVATAISGIDTGPCPVSSITPLVHAHLMAMDNILQRRFLQPLRPRGAVALYALLFLGFTLVCLAEKTSRMGPASFLFAVLYLTASYCGTHYDLAILPVVAPTLYIVLCSFAVLSYRYFTEERAKSKIRKMFSTMVSGQVLAYLEENPASFSLVGHSAEATIFFSDIENFTGLGERLPPARLTELLNSYLTPVTNCMMKHGGYVDKFVGDAVMGVWGAPFPDPNHALNACLAALEQQQMVARMNADWKRTFGTELRVRMGINSGVVTAGNMGSERKFQYTVIGDDVNLASRLEPLNKKFGTQVIIGETTWKLARDRIVARPLGRIVVRGRKEPVGIYELIGKRGDEIPAEKLEIIPLFEEALELFCRREWAEALSLVERILSRSSDGPSDLMRQAIDRFRENPPDADWDGAYVELGE